MPELSRAIEEAAEKITGDTSAYLRAEMREHYRLRGEGVSTTTLAPKARAASSPSSTSSSEPRVARRRLRGYDVAR